MSNEDKELIQILRFMSKTVFIILVSILSISTMVSFLPFQTDSFWEENAEIFVVMFIPTMALIAVGGFIFNTKSKNTAVYSEPNWKRVNILIFLIIAMIAYLAYVAIPVSIDIFSGFLSRI